MKPPRHFTHGQKRSRYIQRIPNLRKFTLCVTAKEFNSVSPVTKDIMNLWQIKIILSSNAFQPSSWTWKKEIKVPFHHSIPRVTAHAVVWGFNPKPVTRGQSSPRLCREGSSPSVGQRQWWKCLKPHAGTQQKLSGRWFHCYYWLATLIYFSTLQFSIHKYFQQVNIFSCWITFVL